MGVNDRAYTWMAEIVASPGYRLSIFEINFGNSICKMTPVHRVQPTSHISIAVGFATEIRID